MPSKTYLKAVVDEKDYRIKSLSFQNKQLEKKITDLLLLNKNLRDDVTQFMKPIQKKWYQFWKS